MGQKISNPKCKLLLHYYVFQKTIQKYLTDWKDKKDRHKLEKGYIIDPDWIKEWKRISDYDNIKTKYLDCLGIESTNINDNLNLVITQHLQPVIKDYEQNLIYYVKMNDFNVSNTFFSLEYLQNLCDVTTYDLLETNGEVENVEYILKKKMLIIFLRTRNIIKIVLFNEKNNNIINLKYIYNNNDKYKTKYFFFERKSSEQILKYLSEKNIFNLKKYELYNPKTNNLIYTLLYEEENNNPKLLNTAGNPNNGNVLTNNNNTNNNNTITNNTIANNNKTNNTDTNNSNIELNNSITQSENSLLETTKNGTEISQSLNENKTNKEDSELKTEEEDENTIQRATTFLERNNVIAVHFYSGDNRINKAMACQTNYTFKSIEEKLYREYPEIKNDVACFLANGESINREKTFEDNKIKDGDTIIICFNNYDTPGTPGN